VGKDGTVNSRGSQRASVLRSFVIAAVFVVAIAVLWVFDARLVDALRVDDVEAIKIRDWWQFLRAVGYLPTWLAVGGALALASVPISRASFAPAAARRARVAGLAIVASALASGLAAEVAKRLVGRVRPSGDNANHFKPFLSAFTDDSNLSMPSSHAAVAFGAAWMVWRLAPAPGALALVLAAGCGLTRLLVGAHYATDVLVGAAIGYAAAALVSKVLRVKA
jgi:membrane-associated phospholipid phosphatase